MGVVNFFNPRTSPVKPGESEAYRNWLSDPETVRKSQRAERLLKKFYEERQARIAGEAK